MYPTYSPLKSLAAFAIAFVAGAVVTSSVSLYGSWRYRKGSQDAGEARQQAGS